jgi:hypothetical protein
MTHSFCNAIIYHKSVDELYILRYTSDHSRHIHHNLPYAALQRAARICSDVNDFNSECIRVVVPLLLNKYPSDFISRQFDRLYRVHNIIPVLKLSNEHVYHRLHQTLLNQMIRREEELHKMMQDLITSPSIFKSKIRNHKIMYPRYLFDSQHSIHLPTQFYKWWHTHYSDFRLPVHNIAVRLTANSNPTLENVFIHKKPPREILTRMESAKQTPPI